ncbi:MAG: ABC transporter permease, partial [Fidelibacterota bacterium]
IPALPILVIPALTTVLHNAAVTIIITITAPMLFDAPVLVNLIGFTITFLLMAFACAGLGVLIGVVSPSSRMTVLWSQLIFLPSMLLGGMMIPYSILPGSVRIIAQLMPATHAMNAFRGLAQNLATDFNPVGSLVILFVSGVLAFGLAIYLFSWDRLNARRRGHPSLGLLAMLPYVVGILLLS